jgi:serine/threonine-protein kinase
VPALVGMPVEQAELTLSRAGLSPRRRTVADNEYPPGYVVGQSPQPGTEIAGGSVVTLMVSAGARRTAEVPDVLGLSRAEAEKTLEGAGFEVDVQVQAEADPAAAEARKGKAWKQSPGGGSPADAGSTVVLWVNPG